MRIVAIGDNCLDWYVDENRICPGGNALNVAVFSKRLGIDSAYVGQFGDDAGGELMLEALKKEGVDISHTRRVPGTSAYATIELIDGDRTFKGSSSGVVSMKPSKADLQFASTADIVHTGAHSFMETSLPRLSQVSSISFDFTTRPYEYCEPLLKHVTFASFSRAKFSASEVERLIENAHALGVRDVYVTQGEAGSWNSDGNRIHHQPAARVAKIVDTMGAGDSYIAAMLKGRVTGLSIEESAARASLEAAAICTITGAIGYCGSAEGMQEADDYKAV